MADVGGMPQGLPRGARVSVISGRYAGWTLSYPSGLGAFIPSPGLHVPKDRQLPPVLQRDLVMHLEKRLRLSPLGLLLHPFVD